MSELRKDKRVCFELMNVLSTLSCIHLSQVIKMFNDLRTDHKAGGEERVRHIAMYDEEIAMAAFIF